MGFDRALEHPLLVADYDEDEEEEEEPAEEDQAPYVSFELDMEDVRPI